MSEEDNIIREVEEDLRRERYRELWKRYGSFVIGTVAVVLVSMLGWQQWQAYQDRQREKEAAAFIAAVNLLEEGKEAAAANAFGELAKDAGVGYRAVARLHEAEAYLEQGNPEQALAAFDALIADGSVNPRLRGLAALKSALLLADSAPPEDLKKRLSTALQPQSPWRYAAQEIVAYSYYRVGQFGEARNAYQTLVNQYDAPSGIRERARGMLVLIGSEEAQGKGSDKAEDADQGQDAGPPAPAEGNAEETDAEVAEEEPATEEEPSGATPKEDAAAEDTAADEGDEQQDQE